MFCSRRTLLRAIALVLAPMSVAWAQSNVVVSPFVSYVPSATTNPLAGFALTFGGTTGLALRSSAEISISNPDTAIGRSGYRPWGADADAMLYLGGLGGGATVFRRSLSPYVFSGIGLLGSDSSGKNVVSHGWSYGLGANIPLGLDADLFAESRWRLSQYVLPTSKGAPDSKSELRFGISFHVGGGSSEPQRRSPPRRRHRMEEYDDEEYVVTPVAPQPQTVVVQAPPPTVIMTPSQPQTVIVQTAPEPSTMVNINLPGSVVYGSSRSRRSSRPVYVVNSSRSSARIRSSGSSTRRVQQVEVRSSGTTARVSSTKAKIVEMRKRKPE